MSTLTNFMNNLNNLQGRADTMSDQVNDFTKQAVRLYFETDNPSPVNKMLSVSKHLKGINIKQMERYFAATVPCIFDKKAGTFGKKQAKKFDAMKAQHEEFITNNDWFTYELPEKDSNYKLNVEKLIEMVQKKVAKADEDGNTPTVEQLTLLKTGMQELMNNEINALSAKIDSEIADLESEIITPETVSQAA